MKNRKKYDIKFVSACDTTLGGKKCKQTTVETVSGLDVNGIRKVLTDRLDLATDKEGKPYRPAVQDIAEAMQKMCHCPQYIEELTNRYQEAYDLYDDIVCVLDSDQDIEFVTRDFEPFGLQIDITQGN